MSAPAAKVKAADGVKRSATARKCTVCQRAVFGAKATRKGVCQLCRALACVEDMRKALTLACGMIEAGDDRLLASDGPAGGQPPDLTLAEWRTLYQLLDAARKREP